MKQILRNQDHDYISVMAAFCKQITHLFRMNVGYQII